MGIFTDMCICPNQQIVSANQNLNVKNDLERNVLMQAENKDNLEEKNDNKKNNNNNNEVNNDTETYNVSSKGGMMASKRKKKGKVKLSHKGTEKDKKEKNKKNEDNNMINNGLIEDNFDDSNISDTIVSDIILSEKLRLIPKEKKSKIKVQIKVI